MIHMSYELNIDDDNYLYHKLIDFTFMLSLSCKHMIPITLNMAKT
jgi:hypothetical protein